MKRKTILYIAMSLDGFIADENGSVDWLTPQADIDEVDSYHRLMNRIDTVVMGNTTYRQIAQELSPGQWPYEGLKSYVFTTSSSQEDPNVTFIHSDPCAFIRQLKTEDGKDIWILGGAMLVNELIGNNLIDEYQITLIPIILGKGIRLFGDNNQTALLRLDNACQEGSFLTVTYLSAQA